jgi:hypothetical protein
MCSLSLFICYRISNATAFYNSTLFVVYVIQ